MERTTTLTRSAAEVTRSLKATVRDMQFRRIELRSKHKLSEAEKAELEKLDADLDIHLRNV